jgi:hypothetical protein
MAVNISKTSIATEVYNAAGDHGSLPTISPSATHSMFTAASSRIAETWTVSAVEQHDHTLTGQNDANGSIYYLPYKQNMIYSMRLPANPPAGCRKFLTANMSGCRFYIDTITGNGDIIVYHANTTQYGAAAGSAANAQSPGASAVLIGLHQAAQADYAALNPAVQAVDSAELVKYDYAMAGEAEALRKRGQGRTATAPVPTLKPDGLMHTVYTPGQPAEFLGGTTICGFFSGGWKFYYQTWGYISYDHDRSLTLGEGALKLLSFQWGRVHKQRTVGSAVSTEKRVLDHRKIN